jgi:hypothetical protein
MKTLDPRNPVDKGRIKAQIVDSIAREFTSADRGEIVRQVEAEYERLLIGASIVAHIPSLTTGLVRRSTRHHANSGTTAPPPVIPKAA